MAQLPTAELAADQFMRTALGFEYQLVRNVLAFHEDVEYMTALRPPNEPDRELTKETQELLYSVQVKTGQILAELKEFSHLLGYTPMIERITPETEEDSPDEWGR